MFKFFIKSNGILFWKCIKLTSKTNKYFYCNIFILHLLFKWVQSKNLPDAALFLVQWILSTMIHIKLSKTSQSNQLINTLKVITDFFFICLRNHIRTISVNVKSNIWVSVTMTWKIGLKKLQFIWFHFSLKQYQRNILNFFFKTT